MQSRVPFKIKNIRENHVVNYPGSASLYYALGKLAQFGYGFCMRIWRGPTLLPRP